MYTTSDGYKEANLQYDKKYESKIIIGSKTITNDSLISFTIQQSIQQDETFSIGNTISSCLNLIFLHNDIETDDKDVIDLRLGLLVNEIYEYIPLGIYNIHSIDSNDTTTTLLCYDNMVKFDIAYSENNENPTLYTVINRLAELTGIKFGGMLSDFKDYKLKSLKGYSCREVLGFVAGVLGANAIINREGKFDFISLSTQPIYAIERFELVTKDGSVVMTKDSEVVEVKAQVGYAKADNYYDYTKKNKNYKIQKVINSSDIEDMSLGSIDDNSVCLSMNNPFVDKDILQDIYSKLNGLEFLPYSLNWSGDISIDLGDLITVTDSKEVMRCHPVLSQIITYNGALNTILGASGDTKLANTYVTKTEQEAELDRTQGDLEDTKEEVNNVKAEINVLQDSIELKVDKTEMDDLETRISSAEQKITSDAIVSTVSSEFYKKTETDNKYLTENSSVITQISDSIESKVNSGDVQTLVTQNATSWGLSINGKLKGTNYNFDGDNFTIGDSGGDTTAYHNSSQSKWVHSDGSYTQADSGGLVKYVGSTKKSYHYLIETGTVTVGKDSPSAYPEQITVQLPSSFKGKAFRVTISVSTVGRQTAIPTASVSYRGFDTAIMNYDYVNGRFDIRGRSFWRDMSTQNYELIEGFVDVSYTVIA